MEKYLVLGEKKIENKGNKIVLKTEIMWGYVYKIGDIWGTYITKKYPISVSISSKNDNKILYILVKGTFQTASVIENYLDNKFKPGGTKNIDGKIIHIYTHKRKQKQPKIIHVEYEID